MLTKDVIRGHYMDLDAEIKEIEWEHLYHELVYQAKMDIARWLKVNTHINPRSNSDISCSIEIIVTERK